jgi:hypothetical protein
MVSAYSLACRNLSRSAGGHGISDVEMVIGGKTWQEKKSWKRRGDRVLAYSSSGKAPSGTSVIIHKKTVEVHHNPSTYGPSCDTHRKRHNNLTMN